MHWSRQDRLDKILVLLACLVAVLIYSPGLHGDFVFDDIHVVVHNSELQANEVSIWTAVQAAFSSESGTLFRPVAMLSFWANYLTTGLDPFFFKLTGLLVHLAVGLLLYQLAYRLLELRSVLIPDEKMSVDRGRLLAAFCASIWLLHPINLTGVLYVCQRMTSLAALFTILGLTCYLSGRQDLESGRAYGVTKMLLGPVLFGLLALFSKEIGILIGAYLLSIELAFFRFKSQHSQVRRGLIVGYVGIVSLAIALLILFLTVNPSWLQKTYLLRNFTMAERLMTESRVLWSYLQWIITPASSELGLFHDDIAVSRGLLAPASTLLSLIAWTATLAGAILLRKQFPILLFAVMWFLGGHLLESSVIGLEMVHEHRNYLPSFGPIFLLSYLGIGARTSSNSLRASAALAFCVLLAISTWGRAHHWGQPGTFFQIEAQHHPESSRTNSEAGRQLYLQTLRFGSLTDASIQPIEAYLLKSIHTDRSSLTSLLSLLMLYKQSGRELPNWLMPEFKRRLSTEPNFPTDIFNTLVKLLMDGSIAIPEHEMVDLFEAAFSNPRTGHKTRGTLLVLAASYYGNVQHEFQKAVSFVIDATEADPESVQNRLALADLAIQFNRPELALQQLDAAARLDHLRRRYLTIIKLREVAERALPPASTSPSVDSEKVFLRHE